MAKIFVFLSIMLTLQVVNESLSAYLTNFAVKFVENLGPILSKAYYYLLYTSVNMLGSDTE